MRRRAAPRATNSAAPGVGFRAFSRIRRLCLGAAWQLPTRPHEMAGVTVRIALQVILVLGFGFPEIARGRDFGDDLAGPDPGRVDVGDGVECDALLFG